MSDDHPAPSSEEVPFDPTDVPEPFSATPAPAPATSGPASTSAQPAAPSGRRWTRWFAAGGCLTLMGGGAALALAALVGGAGVVALGGGVLAYGGMSSAPPPEVVVYELQPPVEAIELEATPEVTPDVTPPSTRRAPARADVDLLADEPLDDWTSEPVRSERPEPEGVDEDEGLGEILMLDDEPPPKRGKLLMPRTRSRSRQ